MIAPHLLLSLLACQDYQVTKQTAELVVSPDLTDLGAVPVGYAVDAVIRLDNVDGDDVTVQGIELSNIEGDYFGEPDASELVVPSGGTEYIRLVYSPQEVGYHSAELLLISDAKDPEILVDLRAQAVIVDVEIAPQVLDFGNVAPGDEETLEVSLTNAGGADIEVGAADFDSELFSSPTDFPFDLEAGQTRLVDVRFTPADSEPASGTLSLLGGSLALGAVRLQGNDCENGLPEAYDEDSDGYTTCGGDCDDGEAGVRPGGSEACDGADGDCDGTVDEGTECYDDDGDGYTERDGDCSDGDAAVNPGAVEDYGNGVDDDCDGVVDAGTTDGDGDGYSGEADPADCDDADPSAYPGAPELADGVDNDCDGTVDEGTDWYDDDGDGSSERDGDCDDTNPTIEPGASELEDWADNDCDGVVDEGTDHYDDDGDGFTEDGGDCDDADPSVSPAELEVVGDGIDNDCDGRIE